MQVRVRVRKIVVVRARPRVRVNARVWVWVWVWEEGFITKSPDARSVFSQVRGMVMVMVRRILGGHG